MKNLRLSAIAVFFISFLFISCSRESIIVDNETPREILTQGQWSVDYFYAGSDKTAQYSQYQFSFLQNGTVTATDGSNTVSGNWGYLRDASRKDVIRLQLSSQDPNFSELNRDWKVETTAAAAVGLRLDDSELRIRKQ